MVTMKPRGLRVKMSTIELLSADESKKAVASTESISSINDVHSTPEGVAAAECSGKSNADFRTYFQ